MYWRGFIFEAKRSVGRCHIFTPFISTYRGHLLPSHVCFPRPLCTASVASVQVQPPDDNRPTTDAYSAFHSSVMAKHVDGIHASYPALPSGVRSLYTSKTFRADLLDALGVLMVSGRPTDILLADRIIADLPEFGIQVDTSFHDSILRNLLDNNLTRLAQQWLLSMHQKPGGYVPTTEQCELVLVQLAALGNVRKAWTVLNRMIALRITLTNDTFKVYFNALAQARAQIPLTAVEKLARIIEKSKAPYDEAVPQIFFDFYTKRGQRVLAELATDIIRRAYIPPQEITHDARLAAHAKEKGYSAALQLYADLQVDGFQASQSTLLAMLNETIDASVLTLLSRGLAVKAGAPAWAKLIHNAVSKGLPQIALTLYKSALVAGVHPTNAMLHPVLRVLCTMNLRTPSDTDIDRALELYKQYVRLHDEQQYPDTEPSADQGKNATQPDAPIFNTLLRALTSSPNSSKYFPVAVSLLEEMQSRRVVMNVMTTSTVVVILMRSSSTFEEAFQVYESVCRRKNDRVILDQEGYTAVLNAFCTVPNAGPAPPRLYFEIVRDMRIAGLPITAKVYTIILSQLYSLGERLPKDDVSLAERLLSTIRRVHQMLNIDASLTPDTPLWNQLMNAYQRAGSVMDAYRVWESLYRSRLYDNASVSIILDACSHANELAVSQRVFDNVIASGFRLNMRNWNNWLECLCRLGRIDDAVKTLCLEMPQSDTPPDESSVMIVLKFSRQTNQESEVRSRVKQYLPKLWSRMFVNKH